MKKIRKIFLCKSDQLIKNNFFIKYIDSIKDELIVFYDEKKNLKCFSSVCPHLAGEIILKDSVLFCKWHGLTFDKNGACSNSNLKLCLKEFNVEMDEENNIYAKNT